MSSITDMAEKSCDTIFRFIPRPKITATEWRSSRLIAHRGCHDSGRTIYENTLAAFDAACRLGAWGIELDVQWTRDRVPVVIHDPDTGRLPGTSPVEIGQIDFSEVRQFCPLVPTLNEVIDRYGGKTHLMIELKAETMTSKVAKEFKSHLSNIQPVEDYHLMSLEAESFRSIQGVPEQCKLLIATTNTRSMYAEFKKGGFGGFTGHFLLLNRKIRKELAQKNLPWGTGFIDSTNLLAREIRSGAHWIFSNAVETLVRSMEEKKLN